VDHMIHCTCVIASAQAPSDLLGSGPRLLGDVEERALVEICASGEVLYAHVLRAQVVELDHSFQHLHSLTL
jgi:hypothetical protein